LTSYIILPFICQDIYGKKIMRMETVKNKQKNAGGEDKTSTLQIDATKLPRHIAIIMDGNGRWAKKKLLNRIKGHEKGIGAVRTVVETCRELGVAYLTLYAFSVENWQRPKSEVNALMKLLESYLIKEQANLIKNGIRLKAIGNLDRLPPGVRKTLDDVIERTKDLKKMMLILALSYGARWEIVKAALKLAEAISENRVKPEEVTDDVFAGFLSTASIPDPDLLIRTSGELRISNFLLWQVAYSELYVTPTLWPDFAKEDLLKAIESYQKRERRFGMTSDQVSGLHAERK